MALPPEIAPLVSNLLPPIQRALGGNFLGAYLTGSLALGGYDPETSDIDILVVTERPVSRAEMPGLAAAHAGTPPVHEPFGRNYEVYYIDRQTLRRYAPGQTHLNIDPSEALHWTEHRPGWVIERWIVREYGVTLVGPEPKSLVDPVSPDDMRWAAGAELRRRLENWTDGTWPMSEMAPVGSQAFEVKTVCRALYTIETGEASSKAAAVNWALSVLPQRWYALIEWSQQRKDEFVHDETRVLEVLEFLGWAVADRSAAA